LQADASTATANSEALTQGEALNQYLTNGTLPPAYMQQVDQAINDAKTPGDFQMLYRRACRPIRLRTRHSPQRWPGSTIKNPA
jgi:hypothetical protein